MQRRTTVAARAKEFVERMREGEDPLRVARRRRAIDRRSQTFRGVSSLTEGGRADWDLWRRFYDCLDWSDQVAFYAQVAALHPDQSTATQGFAHLFFEALEQDGATPSVIEIGGWDGSLAASVLASNAGIRSWLNFEVAERPVSHPACDDPRYEARIPTDYVWRLPAETFAGHDTLVASHVVEHFKLRDVTGLIERMETLRWCYVEAPLREHDRARSWFGYPGSHVLEVGWAQLEKVFANYGFIVREPIAPHVRCFGRS